MMFFFFWELVCGGIGEMLGVWSCTLDVDWTKPRCWDITLCLLPRFLLI